MILRTGDIIASLFKRSKKWRKLSDEDLKNIKEIMVQIATDMVDLCEKHNLTYIMAYGTALGAIRHKGFIPWDDDMDFYMPRKDYLKFLEISTKEMGDKYYIRSVSKGDKLGVPTCHIRKKGTRYINYGDLISLIHEPEYMKCIYIDIFPLDDAPNNIIIRKLDGLIALILQFIISSVQVKETIRELKKLGVILSNEENKILRFKKYVGIFFSFFDSCYWTRLYDIYVSKHHNDKSKYFSCYCGYKSFRKSILKKEMMLPVSKGDFESHIWNLPNNSDQYLKQIYGDYMTLPPVENRKIHPVFDLNFKIEQK